MKLLLITFYCFIFHSLSANETPWSSSYQTTLLKKVGEQVETLSTYPSLQYPNTEINQVVEKFPQDKILVFAYGSLINPESAARTISSSALNDKYPALAFGFKRIFNYKASNVSRWGPDIKENERAMLNLEPTTTYKHMVNGVVFEISRADLESLIKREVGYDLVPILVADWNSVISEDPSAKVEVAYTFLVPEELRDGIDYTQTKYYPVRRYLEAVQSSAAAYGQEYLDFWNNTTYMGDGTTPITHWNKKTFSGILDTKEP